ncbi:MAG TPA: hypothetical protein VMH87_04455, partial [Pseudomonadales bacterium]|nr:hypothetical protein [Pseudomonadales bacterium]
DEIRASRGFAVSGLFAFDVTRGGALTDSRFAPGYYRVPFQGVQLAAAPDACRQGGAGDGVRG